MTPLEKNIKEKEEELKKLKAIARKNQKAAAAAQKQAKLNNLKQTFKQLFNDFVNTTLDGNNNKITSWREEDDQYFIVYDKQSFYISYLDVNIDISETIAKLEKLKKAIAIHQMFGQHIDFVSFNFESFMHYSSQTHIPLRCSSDKYSIQIEDTNLYIEITDDIPGSIEIEAYGTWDDPRATITLKHNSLQEAFDDYQNILKNKTITVDLK